MLVVTCLAAHSRLRDWSRRVQKSHKLSFTSTFVFTRLCADGWLWDLFGKVRVVVGLASIFLFSRLASSSRLWVRFWRAETVIEWTGR